MTKEDIIQFCDGLKEEMLLRLEKESEISIETTNIGIIEKPRFANDIYISYIDLGGRSIHITLGNIKTIVEAI